MFLWVIFEILELFVKLLTVDDGDTLQKNDIYRNQFKCNYLRKKDFWIFPFISEICIKFLTFFKERGSS